MQKLYIIYNILTKKFYTGTFDQNLYWNSEVQYSEFYSEKEDAEKFISTLTVGLYQIIEVYRP